MPPSNKKSSRTLKEEERKQARLNAASTERAASLGVPASDNTDTSQAGVLPSFVNENPNQVPLPKKIDNLVDPKKLYSPKSTTRQKDVLPKESQNVPGQGNKRPQPATSSNPNQPEMARLMALNQLQQAAAMTAQEEERRQRLQTYVTIVKGSFSKEGIELTDEEALEVLEADYRVRLPLFMLLGAIMKDGVDVLDEVISAVLIFLGFTAPVGIATELINKLLQVPWMFIMFFWIKGYCQEPDSFFKKVGFMRRYIYRYIARRGWAMAAEFLPIGSAVPMNTIMVFMVYRHYTNLAEKAQKNVKEALAQAGL